jgi:hypothetical protein
MTLSYLQQAPRADGRGSASWRADEAQVWWQVGSSVASRRVFVLEGTYP